MANGTQGEQLRAEENKDEMLPFRYLFAMRLPPLDWEYEKTPGVAYAVGVSFFIDGIEAAYAAAVTVDPETGLIHVPRRHTDNYTGVITKKDKRKTNRKAGKTGKARKNPGAHKQKRILAPSHRGYSIKKFDKQKVFDGFGTRNTGTELLAKSMLMSALRIHRRRADCWQVSTRKKNSRVSFGIFPNDAKYFFKDRDATAIGPDGKRRKIIHFVKAHTRNARGKISKVKAHLRGVRNFYWGTYEVAVIVPESHVLGYKFDVPVLAGRVDEDPCKFISELNCADRLADFEDYREYRHGKVGLADVGGTCQD